MSMTNQEKTVELKRQIAEERGCVHRLKRNANPKDARLIKQWTERLERLQAALCKLEGRPP